MALSGCRCGPRWSGARCALLLAALAAAARADSSYDRSTVAGVSSFRKCCPAGESLLKLYPRPGAAIYDCMSQEEARNKYKVVHAPLVVGQKYHTIDGFPVACNSSELLEMEREYEYDVSTDVCSDRLVSEIVDDVPQTEDSRLVMLGCPGKNSSTTTEIVYHRPAIGVVRKCCPAGQSYDVTIHVCRDDGVTKADEWLISRLGGVDIYETEYDMRCESGLYGVEFREDSYDLRLSSSDLSVRSTQGQHEGVLGAGAWCADREAGADRLVVRGCTTDCAAFGAYCIRKCCPMNQHYQPIRCNTTISYCVPDNSNASSFNFLPMLNPHQSRIENFPGES
ncbi:hypothetical protein EVAR_46477_1 [Eumeta japonica]|uniref:Uncharacterized protein n=1 Tax=Eumeta variegata TaxID=151549 RepID=A0A4C1XGU5_EUMVA|nr:hypothetical protein EVAR_46477_1 [Eumeta japonica]